MAESPVNIGISGKKPPSLGIYMIRGAFGLQLALLSTDRANLFKQFSICFTDNLPPGIDE